MNAAHGPLARFWQIAIAAAIGCVVGAAIAIPVTLVITGENSRTNCGLVTELAKLELAKAYREGPETERFERESKDRFGLSQRRFDELIANTRAEQLHRLEVYGRVAKHNCG